MGTVSVRSQCLPPFNCESINSCFCVLPSKHASIFAILLSVLYDIRTSELLSSRPAGPANPEGQAPPIHYPPTNSHALLTSIKRITYKLHGVAFPLNPWPQDTTRMQNCSHAASASLGSGLHLHWHAQTLSESLLDRWERNGGTGRNNQAFAPNSLCQ